MLSIDNYSTNNHNLQQRSPQQKPHQLSLFAIAPEREDPQLLCLLERVCSDRQSSNREVAA